MANQGWVSLLNPASPHASGGVAGTGISQALAASGTYCMTPVTGVANQDVAQVNPEGQPLGWYAGLLIRVTARGFYTCSGTTGTLTMMVRANKGNSTAASTTTTLCSTNGITTGATAFTGAQWKLEALIRCVAVGTSGSTVYSQGEFELGLSATPAVPPTNPVFTAAYGWKIPMPNISGETAAAVDTTQIQGIDLIATSTAAQGTLVTTEWLVEGLD